MGDDSVSLTAAGALDVQAAVQNAIHNVLGHSNAKQALSSREDLNKLKKDLNLESINKTLAKLNTNLFNLFKVQVNAVKNDAAAQKTPGKELGPLNQIAAKLELIYGVLKEQFKPTGLGSEDDNKGMLASQKKEKEKEKEKKETAVKSGGSAFVGGTIVAATLMSIKDYLEETWIGLAQRFLKPFVAVQLAIKGLPKSLTGLNSRFAKLASNIGKGFTSKFPRLSKLINKLLTPLKWLTTKVKGFGKSIISAVKNFKFSKIFAPVTKWLSKLGGTAGFGKLFKWLSPIGGLLKKLAFPITLAIEAYEAFRMMFVGSFTKNAEAMAESISEKGVIGRAWYGFTHMFQTIAAAVKTQFDTIMQTFDILFSDHPDGMVGKLKNIGEIILTPIKTMFEDFIIYPIQKALAFLPDWMIKVADPDDAEKGSENNVDVGDRSKRLDAAKQNVKDKAAKYGTTEKEYEAYLNYKDLYNKTQQGGSGPMGFEDWRDKPKKMNESSALPKPNTTGPYQGAGSPHGQALLNQTANAISITNQFQLPTAGEIINQ